MNGALPPVGAARNALAPPVGRGRAAVPRGGRTLPRLASPETSHG